MNWFTSKGEFKELSQEQLKGLDASQLGAYHSAKSEAETFYLEILAKHGFRTPKES